MSPSTVAAFLAWTIALAAAGPPAASLDLHGLCGLLGTRPHELQRSVRLLDELGVPVELLLRARDAAGRPVPGAELRLDWQGDGRVVVTDGEGTARLRLDGARLAGLTVSAARGLRVEPDLPVLALLDEPRSDGDAPERLVVELECEEVVLAARPAPPATVR